MSVRVVDHALWVRDIQTRMPFRYGIAAMTRVPHLVVELELEADGRRARGLAAESLVPKWFTKDPDSPYADDIRDMLAQIEGAVVAARAAGGQASAFALWRLVYEARAEEAGNSGTPGLLANLGTSLVERALLDGVCRSRGQTLADALRGDGLGFEAGYFHASLRGAAPDRILPRQPLRTLQARHTVGLGDPLTETDIPEEERLDDGLPQSLEAVVRGYGVRWFKIKIGGQAEEDLDRLRRIASLLDGSRSDARYTLDGNEQYLDFGTFRTFWETLALDPALQAFRGGLEFIEQPLHRDIALDPETTEVLRTWEDHPPVIIDESDGDVGGLSQALANGYQGTSHKNCKGVFKSVANLGRLQQLRDENPDRAYVLSGEDLTNVGPVALLQDLAVLASLGIPHAERNGHHYFTGLSMHVDSIQQAMLNHHGDLYRHHTWPDGTAPAVVIDDGRMQLGSVVAAPFGYGPALDLDGFDPLADWDASAYRED